MIVSILKGKNKDFDTLFKKEFGGLPSNATLSDVVKHKGSMMGNHVDSFIKERANGQQKSSSSFKLKINSKSDQDSSKGEKEDGFRSDSCLYESANETKFEKHES
mgnify:CR=1 FL=1